MRTDLFQVNCVGREGELVAALKRIGDTHCNMEWEFGNLRKRMANASGYLFGDFLVYEEMEPVSM